MWTAGLAEAGRDPNQPFGPAGYFAGATMRASSLPSVLTAQVLRDTGRIIDPRYASNVNVAARIPGRLPLLRVVVPTGMSVTLGERITIARSHTVVGDPCTQIPNLLIPTPISGLAPRTVPSKVTRLQ